MRYVIVITSVQLLLLAGQAVSQEKKENVVDQETMNRAYEKLRGKQLPDSVRKVDADGDETMLSVDTRAALAKARERLTAAQDAAAQKFAASERGAEAVKDVHDAEARCNNASAPISNEERMKRATRLLEARNYLSEAIKEIARLDPAVKEARAELDRAESAKKRELDLLAARAKEKADEIERIKVGIEQGMKIENIIEVLGSPDGVTKVDGVVRWCSWLKHNSKGSLVRHVFVEVEDGVVVHADDTQWNN